MSDNANKCAQVSVQDNAKKNANENISENAMYNIVKTSAFGLTLCEDTRTLRLGTDAILLYAYIKSSPKATALEIGAGNGSVSLLLAKRGAFARIYSLEIQSELCRVMKANIELNGFEQIIKPVNADIRNIDPSDYPRVSVVFANPPYMKQNCGKPSPLKEKQIARHEVHGGVNEFCAGAKRVLKTDGRLYIVYRPDRLQSLMAALNEYGFSPKRMTFVSTDAEHSPSCVLCEAVLGGKETLCITPPLFLTENGKTSPDCEYIYQNGMFPSKYLLK